MSASYLDEVKIRLTSLLKEIPSRDLTTWMNECEAAAGDYLNVTPRRDSPAQFSEDLLSDPNMVELVRQDQHRLAMSADFPNEVVANLVPSDGHLD